MWPPIEDNKLIHDWQGSFYECYTCGLLYSPDQLLLCLRYFNTYKDQEFKNYDDEDIKKLLRVLYCVTCETFLFAHHLCATEQIGTITFTRVMARIAAERLEHVYIEEHIRIDADLIPPTLRKPLKTFETKFRQTVAQISTSQTVLEYLYAGIELDEIIKKFDEFRVQLLASVESYGDDLEMYSSDYLYYLKDDVVNDFPVATTKPPDRDSLVDDWHKFLYACVICEGDEFMADEVFICHFHYEEEYGEGTIEVEYDEEVEEKILPFLQCAQCLSETHRECENMGRLGVSLAKTMIPISANHFHTRYRIEKANEVKDGCLPAKLAVFYDQLLENVDQCIEWTRESTTIEDYAVTHSLIMPLTYGVFFEYEELIEEMNDELKELIKSMDKKQSHT